MVGPVCKSYDNYLEPGGMGGIWVWGVEAGVGGFRSPPSAMELLVDWGVCGPCREPDPAVEQRDASIWNKRSRRTRCKTLIRSKLSWFWSAQMWVSEESDLLELIEVSLTWRGGLHLGSLVLFVVCKDLRGRVFATFYFTLKGVQTLDVLFFQRAGSTAGHAHIQGGGQVPPFLILIDLLDTQGQNQKLKRPGKLMWFGTRYGFY